MKKSTTVTIAAVSVIGALVLALGAVSSWFTNWNYKTWFGRGDNATVNAGAKIEDDCVTLTPGKSEDGKVALAVRRMSAADSKVAYPSYSLTATVSGSGISSPKIDWTIEKMSDFSSLSTSPVTVTPTSDGASTATVTCKAAFSGGLNVVATLRDVGSFAKCSVVFEGIPSELNVSTSISKNGEYYEVSSKGSHVVTMNLDNVFHSVGSKYGNYTITATPHGSVNFTGKTYNSLVNAYMPSGGSTKNLSELDASRLMTFSMSGNKLTINVNGALSAYSYADTVDGGGTGLGSQTTMYSYSSEKTKCYYEVKVTDSVSGLYTTFKVAWSGSLTSKVSVSQDKITF